MRKFSKVLAVVLALTLLVATGVLPASAVDTENAALKLSFKNADEEEITSAATGDVIDVYVSLKVDAYVQAMQFYVNYNSEYVTHSDIRKTEVTEIKNAKYAGNWLGDFTDDSEIELTEGELYDIDAANLDYGYYLNWGAGATMTITPYNASTMPTPPVATTKLVKVVYATETSDQTLLVNTKGEFYEMVQLRFIATKDIATLDSSIFFFDNDLEKVIVNIDSENVPFSTLAINAAKNLNVTFEYAGGTTPAPVTVKVNNLSTQVQWANKDAGLMNLGFRGQIAEGYDATADDAGTTGPNGGKNLAKLTEVGFYLNGTKYQAYTIYNFVNGGYFYRVVVGNVSYDSETEFSAQAYVVIDGTEYKAADATTITTTGKAQYERAKDAMGAK